MGGTGLEHHADLPRDSATDPTGGAQDGAFPNDPDLAAVVDAWPALSDVTKAAMVILATGRKLLN